MFGAVGLTACDSSGSGGNDTNNDDIKEAEKEIEDELDNVVLEFSEEEELFGRNGNVITLGEYLQKLKTDKSEITDEQNEKGYYKGTNGCWYAKVTVENIAKGIFFSTSKEDKVVVGETYYFFVEPLLCDNIIDCVPYQSLYTTDMLDCLNALKSIL